MSTQIFQIEYRYKLNNIEIVFPHCNIKNLYCILIDMLMHDKYDVIPSYGWENRLMDDDFYFDDLDKNSIFTFKRIAKHRFNIIINRELTSGWAMGCEDLSDEDVLLICEDLKTAIIQLISVYPEVDMRVVLYEIPLEYWEQKQFTSKKEFIDFQTNEQKRQRKHIVRSTKFS